MLPLSRGQLVYTFDGHLVGNVGQVGDRAFRLDRTEHPAWLRREAVISVEPGFAVLICNASRLHKYVA